LNVRGVFSLTEPDVLNFHKDDGKGGDFLSGFIKGEDGRLSQRGGKRG